VTRQSESSRGERRLGIATSEAHPSSVDRLFAWIDRLPAPPWMFYGLVTAAAAGVYIGLRWIDGPPRHNYFSRLELYSQFVTVYPLALMHYLNATARRSLQAFRPALGKLQAQYRQLEIALTTMSAGSVWAAVVLGLVFTAVSVFQNPSGWGFSEGGMGFTAFGLLQGAFVTAGFIALILRYIQMLRSIVRIHRSATNIDLYERGSHHAFSRLTLAAAVGVLIPVYGYATLVEPIGFDQPTGLSQVDLVLVAAMILISAAVFAVPLYDMRRRLEALKKNALQQCDHRFHSAAQRLHARLDAGRLRDLEALNHAMATLTLERDALQRISTWPWAAETLRGYLSSIALPVFVFLLGRYIGKFFGL
jgi:hypothetical protein